MGLLEVDRPFRVLNAHLLFSTTTLNLDWPLAKKVIHKLRGQIFGHFDPPLQVNFI